MPVSRRALIGASLTAPLLAACGTTEAPRAASPTASASGSAGPLSVTDSRGRTITLAAPARRVVTLEWGPTEDVLTLGVKPVAVADPKGFGTWVSSQTLPADTIDVGLRTEPSLESIAKAEPDLIIGVTGSIPEQALEQAERIAPVVVLEAGDATRPLDHLRENLRTTATLLGRTAEADRALAAFDAKLADGKAALAGSAQSPYAFSYFNLTGGTVDVRLHSERSVPGAVAKELGLRNAWTEPGDDAWGIGSTDLEGLTRFPADTRLLYWANDASDPMATLQNNQLWRGLPFVADGRVKPAANRIWVYGGPASMGQWVDELVKLLG